MMRIQSNGLPDHCYPGKTPLLEKMIDVKFTFNFFPGDPTTYSVKPSTLNELNHLICDFNSSGDAFIPGVSNLQNLG